MQIFVSLGGFIQSTKSIHLEYCQWLHLLHLYAANADKAFKQHQKTIQHLLSAFAIVSESEDHYFSKIGQVEI